MIKIEVKNSAGSMTSNVTAGNHLLVGDEPIEVGGKDLGPTPYDYLLVSLGTCTAMTLRLYSDRKKWDLQEVNVKLSHAKDYASDCENCENSSTKIDIINKEIELIGELDSDQRKRLMQIADKCPVHKTLTSDIQIHSQLVS